MIIFSIYSMLISLRAQTCFPGDFTCDGEKMKICTKKGQWVITECPIDTKCVLTEHAISCSAFNNIILELEPRIVSDKIVPLIKKEIISNDKQENQQKNKTSFNIEASMKTLDVNPSEEDNEAFMKERLRKYISNNENLKLLSSLIFNNDINTAYLAAGQSNYNASQIASSSGSMSSGSSASSSSGSFSASASGSSSYSLSGANSQQIAVDQKKADQAQSAANISQQNANNIQMKANNTSSVQNTQTNTNNQAFAAQAQNEADCKQNTASAMQNVASQEQSAQKSTELEKQNEIKADNNVSSAESNLENQKQQAAKEENKQQEALQKAEANCEAAQKQLGACQDHAHDGSAKTPAEQQQLNDAVKQAQLNLDEANENKALQQENAKLSTESEAKVIEQAEKNVEAAKEIKSVQSEEAKATMVNEQNAIRQAKENELAAEKTEATSKSSKYTRGFSGSFGLSGNTSNVSQSNKSIETIGKNMSSATFQSMGSGGSGSYSTSYYGTTGSVNELLELNSLRRLRDMLKNRRRQKFGFSQQIFTLNGGLPKTSLCEPSGNNLMTCKDDATGKTVYSPSFSIFGNEYSRQSEQKPWHRSFWNNRFFGYPGMSNTNKSLRPVDSKNNQTSNQSTNNSNSPNSSEPSTGKLNGASTPSSNGTGTSTPTSNGTGTSTPSSNGTGTSTPSNNGTSPGNDDLNKPSYTGNDNLNQKPNNNENTGNGNQMITVEQLNRAMLENGFLPPAENIEAIVKETNEYFKDPEMAAMFLGQLAHESGGFIYREEMGCEKGQCAFMYPTGGAPGKSYHGRGFIQLSYPENYKLCSQDLGYGDLLWEKPEMVSDDPQLSSKVSTWYWDTRVMTYPGVTDKKEFGLTTRAINGAVECNGQNIDKSKRRYTLYKAVAKQMGITNLVGEGGCY